MTTNKLGGVKRKWKRERGRSYAEKKKKSEKKVNIFRKQNF